MNLMQYKKNLVKVTWFNDNNLQIMQKKKMVAIN